MLGALERERHHLLDADAARRSISSRSKPSATPTPAAARLRARRAVAHRSPAPAERRRRARADPSSKRARCSVGVGKFLEAIGELDAAIVELEPQRYARVGWIELAPGPPGSPDNGARSRAPLRPKLRTDRGAHRASRAAHRDRNAQPARGPGAPRSPAHAAAASSACSGSMPELALESLAVAE